MMTSDGKVGGWVKKGQNHDDVMIECPLRAENNLLNIKEPKRSCFLNLSQFLK